MTDSGAIRSSVGTGRLGLVLGLFLLVSVLYWPSTDALIQRWVDFDKDTYVHGSLVLVLSGWFIWRRRYDLQIADARPNPVAMLLLVLGSIAWLVCFLASIEIGHQILFPVLFGLAVCACLGWNAARVLAFPLAYFYLAIPVWQVLVSPLKKSTVLAVHALLMLCRVPVEVMGNIIEIPEGAFEVGDGCVGLNFVLVAAAISAFYGELIGAPVKRRFRMLAAALMLGLFANWLRVFIVVMAGHLTQMQHYLVVRSHYGFGWLIFALVMGAFLWFVRPGEPVDASHRPAVIGHGRLLSGWAAVVTVLILAAVPVVSWQIEARTSDAIAKPLFGVFGPSWKPVDVLPLEWHPVYQGADAEQLGAYSNGRSTVGVYRAVYAYQRQGKELINWGNSPYDKGEWELVDQQAVQVAGRPFVALRIRDAEGHEAVIWYSYMVAGKAMISDVRAQLWYAVSSLLGRPEAAVWVIRADCAVDCSSAQASTREFASILARSES